MSKGDYFGTRKLPQDIISYIFQRIVLSTSQCGGSMIMSDGIHYTRATRLGIYGEFSIPPPRGGCPILMIDKYERYNL